MTWICTRWHDSHIPRAINITVVLFFFFFYIKRFVLLSCVNRFLSLLFLQHDRIFSFLTFIFIAFRFHIQTNKQKNQDLANGSTMRIVDTDMTMIERKMEIEKVNVHDNNSKYIVFNMSLNANVNMSELSNGHTVVVYPIYVAFFWQRHD